MSNKSCLSGFSSLVHLDVDCFEKLHEYSQELQNVVQEIPSESSFEDMLNSIVSMLKILPTTPLMTIYCKNQNDVNKLKKQDDQDNNTDIEIRIGDYQGVENDISDISNILIFKNLIIVEIYGAIITSANILKQCTKLKKIKIQSCPNIISIDFLPFLPDLEELWLINLEISQLMICKANSNLLKLVINYCDQLHQIQGLENCIKLQELYTGLSGIDQITIPANLTSLKTLGVGNETVPKIIGLQYLNKLEKLCTCRTNIQVLHMQSEMKNLKILDSSGCNQLTNIMGLENCPMLEQVLAIQTSISSLDIPKQTKNLKIIRLSQCDQLANITGLKDCHYLEEIDTSYSAIITLELPSHASSLWKINVCWCEQLDYIIGLENCHQLQYLDMDETKIISFENYCSGYQNIILNGISSELILFNTILKWINTQKIQENQTKVQQFTLLKCNCEELVKKTDDKIPFLQLLIDKFDPSCLVITNCTNIDDIKQYVSKFECIKLKHNDIQYLFALTRDNRIKHLEIEHCVNITDFSNIVQCTQLEKLVLKHLFINNLCFLQNNKQLSELHIDDCQQLHSIADIQQLKQLKHFTLTNTKVQDFSPLLLLYNISSVNIQNNYRQETDFIMQTDDNQDQQEVIKKQQFVFKQIKQSCYQLRKQINSTLEHMKVYRDHNYQRTLVASRLCVDIINSMIKYQEEYQ